MCANSFYPAVGGYERVALAIAEQLTARGYLLMLITFTPSTIDEAVFPFRIYRNPRIETICKLMKWCDVFLQNNVSFKLLWPLLLCRRPYVCVHHGFYAKYRQEVLPVRKWLKH